MAPSGALPLDAEDLEAPSPRKAVPTLWFFRPVALEQFQNAASGLNRREVLTGSGQCLGQVYARQQEAGLTVQGATEALHGHFRSSDGAAASLRLTPQHDTQRIVQRCRHSTFRCLDSLFQLADQREVLVLRGAQRLPAARQ